MRLALAIAALACVACAPPPTTPPRDPPPAANTAEPESIGSATIDAAGVITLNLRAEGPGVIGDAQFTYRPGDPDYAEVLRHIGPIRPGETRPVRPWPQPTP
jgi:hypothetical protein